VKLKRKNISKISKNGVYIVTSFFAIVIIGIGYAYINSQINIVGRTKIAANTWNVRFDNLQIKEGSKEDSTVEISGTTTVNFDINLEEQGEFVEFTVDVVNSGTIDAMLDEVVNKGITDESKKYLEYSIKYIDGKEIQEKDFLQAGTEERIVVKAKYKDDIDATLLPEDDDIEDVSLTLSYIQSNSNSITVNHTVCKRATTLHNDGTHTFGNETITQGVLTSGDAFDCDVNKDGIYDSDTERFYYVTDLEENPSYAVLLYYNNISAGEPNSTTTYAYDSNQNPRENGPVSLVDQLPTESQWSNVRLYSQTRTIITTDDQGATKASTDFNYQNRAARLLTYKEAVVGCGIDSPRTAGSLDACPYIMENAYINGAKFRYWLETPRYDKTVSYGVYVVDANSKNFGAIYSQYPAYSFVRPAIEVPKSNIEYNQDLPICKRATTLHSDGTHTFGSIGSGKKDLISGDAFDCDVNGDGIYNSETERFYYIKEDSNNRAVMVYYNSVSAGTANGKVSAAYDSEGTPRTNGPQTAIEQLPTRTQWPRVTLANNSRPIKDENGTTYSTFNYRDHVARFLTYEEVQSACGTGTTTQVGYLNSCSYLMEKTQYSNSAFKPGYWLESLNSSLSYGVWFIHGGTSHRKIGGNYSSSNSSNFGVRPVIEVPNDKVDYGEEKEEAPVCRRAETLHTDGTHTFGTLGSGEDDVVAGDAFDCDVNKDGIYDSETERFYYITDHNTNTASLIYYNNVAAGVPSNTTMFAYDSSGTPRTNGPITALSQIPTKNQWRNVSLSNTSRTITDETGTEYTNFNYNSYAARLLTTQELESVCGITVGSLKVGELDACPYLMENTYYSNHSYKYGYWLENVRSTTESNSWIVATSNRYVSTLHTSNGNTGVRPVIEVPKSKINFGESNKVPVCRRATTLHNDGTHTFGTIGSGEDDLISGDAFDCDVNRDGIYDSETERFYYLSDLGNNTASLIYYNNVAAGIPNNTASYAYDISETPRENGPVTAVDQLPNKVQWKNINLLSPIRTIKDELGTTYTSFNYGNVARLLTYQEVQSVCGSGTTSTSGYLDSCPYLMENTKYSDDSYTLGYWLETPSSLDQAFAWRLQGRDHLIDHSAASWQTSYGVRPVIDISKDKIDYGKNIELPDGYHKVDYIESTGTQYMTINLQPTLTDEIHCTFSVKGNQITSYPAIISAVSNGLSADAILISINNNELNAKYATTEYFLHNSIPLSLDQDYNVVLKRNILGINNEIYSKEQQETGLTNNNYSLFVRKTNTQVFPTTYGVVRLKKCQILQNGQKVIYLIPCVDNNNRPCMYDAVTKTTYYNEGTGEFEVGPVIE